MVSQRVNEVSSFFDDDIDSTPELTLETMRIKVDRALERSLVALPALANVNSDDSEDFNTNNAGMKTKNSNDSRDEKKISLSGYHPAKMSHRQIVENQGGRDDQLRSS